MGWLDKLKTGDIGGALGDAVDGAVQTGKDGLDAIDKATQGTQRGAKKDIDDARQAVGGVIAKITGEEATPPELSADQVKQVQSALGLQQGKVGPKTKAGVDAFLKQHPELGLELGDVVKGDKMIGDPKFLGAVEQYTGKDLAFFTPSPSVQEQLQKGYDSARDTLQQKGSEALGWLEQKARDLCAATGNVNPDGSCKAPEATPGRRTGGVERD